MKPFEKLTYRLIGVKPEVEQDWKQYTFAMLLFSVVGCVMTYVILRLQAHLPLNPQGFDGMLSEMDLDAILERHPSLVIVDELAHTNAPGARHPQRYQDVIELLDAGIDVYTTINIQHIESRSDTVRQITGITIRETVPDSILDSAVLELVDLPPLELLQRLKEGKVYGADRAAAATQHFFQEANLTALRELALRLMADHAGFTGVVIDWFIDKVISPYSIVTFVSLGDFLPNLDEFILCMLCSYDPVALDQACVDLCNKAEGTYFKNSQLGDRISSGEKETGKVFFDNNPETDSDSALEHGEKIGLGSRKYELVIIK